MAYYHIDMALEMADVSYTAPDFLVNDISEPFLNFIGFDEVNRITLYKENTPLTIDVLPREEYRPHVPFDCSKINKPGVIENWWLDLLEGEPEAIGVAVGVGAVSTGGLSFLVWFFVLGGGAAGAAAKKKARKKETEMTDTRGSAFATENPMGNHGTRQSSYVERDVGWFWSLFGWREKDYESDEEDELDDYFEKKNAARQSQG